MRGAIMLWIFIVGAVLILIGIALRIIGREPKYTFTTSETD